MKLKADKIKILNMTRMRELKDDKLDFISCVFEVAYADGKLHYLEHHAVKKIANILHLEKNELISAKAEIENYLD